MSSENSDNFTSFIPIRIAFKYIYCPITLAGTFNTSLVEDMRVSFLVLFDLWEKAFSFSPLWWMHVVFHCMIILHYILLSDIFGVCPDFHYCKQHCSGRSCTCLQLCVYDFLWGLMWGIAGDGIWVSSTINLSPTLLGSATIL